MLAGPGSRLIVHLPTSMGVEQGVEQLLKALRGQEIIVVLSARAVSLSGATFFQTAQLNQAILGNLLNDPARLLIFEAAANLGQLDLPTAQGRVIALTTDFKTLSDLAGTVGFLSGTGPEISSLDLARYLGQIGQMLCEMPAPQPCSRLNFTYEGVPITLPMTRPQYYEYLTRLQRERAIGRRQPYGALQTTNFLYPPPLQQLHNVPREHRPTFPPDLPKAQGGWITPAVLQELSPKLAWLLEYLRLNPGKHIVWTQFNESNGAQLISSIVALAGFQVITVTGTTPLEERSQMTAVFNRPGPKVLVSNLPAPTQLISVNSLIVLEQHSSDAILNSYLRQIATSDDQQSLMVVFLVSTGPEGEETVEVSNYLTMIGSINTRDTILNILKSGRLDPAQLENYRTVFRLPNLTLQDLETAIPRTFGRLVL